jgi:DNA-binding transcriptional MocR family regulator
LQYGVEQGDGYFRAALAKFLTGGYGFSVNPENLLITTGISNALDLLCSYFTKPGDTIFCEEPSYFLALRIFIDHGLNVISVETDENGLIPASLEEKLAAHPKFLYLIPTFRTQPGTRWADRRDQIVKLAKEHDFSSRRGLQLLYYSPEKPPNRSVRM